MPSEERCDQFFADEVLFLLIVRMYGHCFTSAEEFRPRCRNKYEVILLASGNLEFDVIEFVYVVLVFHFCICESGHTTRTPVDRVIAFVDEAPVEEIYERELCDPPVVRGIGLIVDAGIHGFTQHLELVRHLSNLLVGEFFTEFPVFLPGRIEFSDVIFLLDPDFDRCTVDIETEWEEHIHPLHPSVTCCEIDQRITGRVT